jgi:cysteinyl-tRNA synthetase
MAQGELGFGFDIHGGGLDLVFPHHENEIAQAEAAAESAPFARYWLHNGMVNLRGEKMAKSTGNVVSLLDLLDRFPPLAVRLFYLRAHYRAPLDFFEEALADSAASLERLWAFRRRAGRAGTPGPDAVARFAEAMDDDFNTAAAMGVLFDLVRDGHRRLDEGEDAGSQAAAYDAIIGVLGLAEPSSDLDDLAPALAVLAAEVGVEAGEPAATLDALLARRTAARAERAWALGDQIRDRLAALGIVLEDGPDGTLWRRR